MKPGPPHPLQRIYLSAYLLVGVVCLGVAGYMLIERFSFLDSLYMTIITLATVGFGEVKPLSDPGKIFTIILILSGLGIFAYFLSQASRFFFDGEFIAYYKSYSMQKKINELKGHVIVCGYGRNGFEAVHVLNLKRHDTVVVENDPEKFRPGDTGLQYYLTEDATRDETLLRAGVQQASALITTLPDDALNVYVVLTARELNPKLYIISRATHDKAIRKLKNAGANNVIMPDKIGGAHMAMLVHNPDIEEFIDILATRSSEGFQIQEINAPHGVNLSDLDCWKRTGATILGIKTRTGKFLLNPPAETEIHPGDGLIAMGSEDQLRAAKEILSKEK